MNKPLLKILFVCMGNICRLTLLLLKKKLLLLLLLL